MKKTNGDNFTGTDDHLLQSIQDIKFVIERHENIRSRTDQISDLFISESAVKIKLMLWNGPVSICAGDILAAGSEKQSSQWSLLRDFPVYLPYVIFLAKAAKDFRCVSYLRIWEGNNECQCKFPFGEHQLI